MSAERNHRNPGGAIIAAGAAIALILCAFSYYGDPVRRVRSEIPPDGRRELLQENSPARWWTIGSVSEGDVHFSDSKAGGSEIEIRNEAFSTVAARYTVGLFYSGWYELTGEVRVEEAAGGETGAQFTAATLHWSFGNAPGTGVTGGWRRTDIYFRPSAFDPEITVSCQLGGVGVAFFRNIHVVSITGVPPADATKFDLEATAAASRAERMPAGHGDIRSVAVTILIAAIIAAVCWRLLGGSLILAGPKEPAAEDQTTA